MAIPVYDYRQDIANVVVHPEIRARFMRVEPGPVGRMHSHDLGGEIFLVLEGQCEFIFEDERVTCDPGQLIYVEPRVKHTLRAVGDEPCIIYLSVTPHVEPTHTHYDAADHQQPPRYGAWRGTQHRDPDPDRPTVELVESYMEAARGLAELAHVNAEELHSRLETLAEAVAATDQRAVKQTVDDMWISLRDVLQQVSEVERRWNDVAPRGMPTDS